METLIDIGRMSYCSYELLKVVCKMTDNMQQLIPLPDPLDEKFS